MKYLPVLSVLCSPVVGFAASVSFSGPVDVTGAGFGNVLSVLALQGNGFESGAVSWNGSVDVRSGDAKPFSQTRTVAEFTSAGARSADFGVVFNIAQPGANPAVTLNQFAIIFYDKDGNELFSANYDTPRLLDQIQNGVGGAGYLFLVSFTPTELSFFDFSTNRIGIRVTDPITGSQGAPENFFLVPSPSTAALLMMLLKPRRK